MAPVGDAAHGLPALIVVNGAPDTGKTTLARRLADRLVLPLVTKDGIKETLFETLGWSDRTWSRRLGGASMEVLYLFAEAQLAARRSCIVEANFAPSFANPALRRIAARCPFLPIQILCTADCDVLAARFRQRVRSGERHPGHQDCLLGGDDGMFRRLEPLDIGGHLIEVDTTLFERVDFEGLCARVARLLPRSRGGRGR